MIVVVSGTDYSRVSCYGFCTVATDLNYPAFCNDRALPVALESVWVLIPFFCNYITSSHFFMFICSLHVFGEYTPHSTQLSCSTVRYHRALTRESAWSLPQLPHLKQDDIVFVVRINHYQVFHVNALSSLNSTQMWNLV